MSSEPPGAVCPPRNARTHGQWQFKTKRQEARGRRNSIIVVLHM